MAGPGIARLDMDGLDMAGLGMTWPGMCGPAMAGLGIAGLGVPGFLYIKFKKYGMLNNNTICITNIYNIWRKIDIFEK